MFKRILIANRGEIALRIIRTCKFLGIESVSVYSTADRDSEHVRMADYSVCIGDATPHSSYLNNTAIISAAELTRCDAIHPGYGFLSENALFAEQCEASGFHFIGPNSKSIALMGNKISAIEAVKPFGIEGVPGISIHDQSHDELVEICNQIGFPVLVKSAFAGGGRGMRVVNHASELNTQIKEAKREAEHACKNATVYIEKYLKTPRHIEMQVLADASGNVLVLGERDCSVQRRYQKIIEEAPAINLPEQLLNQLRQKVIRATTELGYIGAGTFEFLYQDEAFYFIEMNTRLQVEHPTTEEVFGIDIVQKQIEIAAGHALTVADLSTTGHAIECRLVAEHPITQMPSPGKITKLRLPGGANVRVESDLYQGKTVTPYYDPMIAKIISYGTDRNCAIRRMKIALNELIVEGFDTNRDILLDILNQNWFIQQDTHTNTLTKHMETNKNEITT